MNTNILYMYTASCIFKLMHRTGDDAVPCTFAPRRTSVSFRRRRRDRAGCHGYRRTPVRNDSGTCPSLRYSKTIACCLKNANNHQPCAEPPGRLAAGTDLHPQIIRKYDTVNINATQKDIALPKRMPSCQWDMMRVRTFAKVCQVLELEVASEGVGDVVTVLELGDSAQALAVVLLACDWLTSQVNNLSKQFHQMTSCIRIDMGVKREIFQE